MSRPRTRPAGIIGESKGWAIMLMVEQSTWVVKGAPFYFNSGQKEQGA